MKKLRVLLVSLLLAFFCAAGVSADAADPGFTSGSVSVSIILLVLLIAVILSAVGVAIWIIARSGKK